MPRFCRLGTDAPRRCAPPFSKSRPKSRARRPGFLWSRNDAGGGRRFPHRRLSPIWKSATTLRRGAYRGDLRLTASFRLKWVSRQGGGVDELNEVMHAAK